jgi:hypothetical protein
MMRCACATLVVTLSLGSLTAVLSEEPTGAAEPKAVAVDVTEAAEAARPSMQEARRQAEILHTAVHSTLHAVHHRFYRLDEGLPIPAAVLQEMFAELEKEHHVKLRWLAVEGQAMNADNKPKGSFEDEAVAALKAGKKEFEQVEEGVYRRAGSIALTNQCLKCHVPDRKNTAKRTAGLIIAIPIKQK